MHSEHNLLTNFVPAIHFSIALPVIVQFLNLDSFSAMPQSENLLQFCKMSSCMKAKACPMCSIHYHKVYLLYDHISAAEKVTDIKW